MKKLNVQSTCKTLHEGNSEFLLEILTVPRGQARPVIRSFVIPPNSKILEIKTVTQAGIQKFTAMRSKLKLLFP